MEGIRRELVICLVLIAGSAIEHAPSVGPSTPSSVSLLPIPLALICRTLNVLSSLISSADGSEVGGGECGDRDDCLCCI